MNKELSKQDLLLNLLSNYTNIDHAHELQKIRASDNDLKRVWLYTADFWPATNVDGKIVKYNLADGPFNLIFRNKEKAIPDILSNGFYKCDSEEMKDVFNNSEEIVSNDITFTDGCNYAYFEVDTTKPQDLQTKNLVMAQRVHGRTLDQYLDTMKMLRNNDVGNIKTTNIYFLNPKYVLQNTVPGESIARVSALDSFDIYSDFSAGYRNVGSERRRLRGVLKGAEGTTQKNDVYANALKTLMSNEGQDYLINNPEATGKLYKFMGPALMKMKRYI